MADSDTQVISGMEKYSNLWIRDLVQHKFVEMENSNEAHTSEVLMFLTTWVVIVLEVASLQR